MGEERLPQRVMFGELLGGNGYSGGQEKDWMAHLKEDMSVFGMKFEGWRKAAQMGGGGKGGAGGGDVTPKRLKSVSGHHRLDICGPSNGRHNIALDRPDFAMLRSFPSAIDDALDTLYEPNAVFTQFLGSANMTFFSLFLSLLF